jgi:hypothetical protein
MQQRDVLSQLVLAVAIGVGIGLVVAILPSQGSAFESLGAPGTSDVAAASTTPTQRPSSVRPQTPSPAPTSGTSFTAPTVEPSPVPSAGSVEPSLPTAASPAATRTPATSARVGLSTMTDVARMWRDDSGTVRVHVVVSATNATDVTLSLANGERSYRIISPTGRTLYTGWFPYAFPPRLTPGQTSHLVTTAVLPLSVAGGDVRVQPTISGEPADAELPPLEVSDLRLVDRGGQITVTGVVRDPGPQDVRDGIVGVLCLDSTGAVVGGLYDNAQVAVIPSGGRARFETAYPGLPPIDAGMITALRGEAFDLDSP